MRTYLIWSPLSPSDHGEAQRVAAKVYNRFDQVFRGQTPPETRSAAGAHLMHFDAPVKNWTAVTEQQDPATWALASMYPVGAARLTRADRAAQDPELPALARRLQADHDQTLRTITGPFTLIWEDKARQTLHLNNDAAGRAPVFLWRRGDRWAITNRVQALAALGIALEPVAHDWAARWALSFFPNQLSGFKDVRQLSGGADLTIRHGTLKHRQSDVLTSMMQVPPLSQQDAVDLVIAGYRQFLSDAAPLMDKASIGLSGGYDSRIIAAAALDAGWQLHPRTRGEDWRLDVQIARRLAAAVKLDLKVTAPRSESGPGTSAQDARDSILRSLILSAGERTPRSYKRYFARGKRSGPGRAEITGRLEFLKSRKVLEAPVTDLLEAQKFAPMDHGLPRPDLGFKGDLRDAVFAELAVMKARADDLGFSGARRGQYYSICQIDRRFGSGHTSARTGMELCPNFAPDVIRAAFSIRDWSGPTNPIHRHVIARLRPEWQDIPYEADVRKGTATLPGAIPEPAAFSAAGFVRKKSRDTYSNDDFWATTGQDVMQQVVKSDGFWAEVFDPDQIERISVDHPDELVITGLLPESLT